MVELSSLLDRFFTHDAPTSSGDTILVAYSGGGDSTALLAALLDLAPRRGLHVLAGHLDHGIDPGSAARAQAAAALARSLGADCTVERRPVGELALSGESPETAARRVRYRFLEDVRRAHGARWIATAHHRGDQTETLVLRMLQGTGIEGLAAILPRRGRHVVRPLLDVPQDELHRFAERALPVGTEVVEDPTNRDLRIPRNRVRRLLLPRLDADEPGISRRLARLAEAARGAREAVERRLEAELAPPRLAGPVEREGRDRPAGAAGAEGAAVRLSALVTLPEPLAAFALGLLHRRAGAPRPAGRAARAELLRQLADPRTPRAGVDAGGGWRWQVRGDFLALGPRRPGAAAGGVEFSYRLPAPGEVEVPEAGGTLRLRREPVAPWMFRGSRDRAAVALPADRLDALVVRSRRPGDRLRPLGAPGERKLKDVLIDRRVPRRERDRLPLLCVADRIAWVPGVTVAEAFRLPERLRDEGGEVWTVELDRGGGQLEEEDVEDPEEGS